MRENENKIFAKEICEESSAGLVVTTVTIQISIRIEKKKIEKL